MSAGMRAFQAAEERGAALAAEVAVLGEELTRVGAVAARATSREIAGGSKDEGIVPVAMHMEEARSPALMRPSKVQDTYDAAFHGWSATMSARHWLSTERRL